MWRFALFSSVLALLGSAAWAVGTPSDNPADPVTALTSLAGVKSGPTLNIQDTMNFEDCAEQKIKSCGVRTCYGEPTWVMALDYREPTVLVEVSCRPGQSMLLENTVTGKMAGKVLSGAMKAATAIQGGKCLEQVATGTGGKPGQNGTEGPWQFEARTFAITPLDRFMAASKSGSKLKAAAYNLTCDALMYFGAESLGGMLSGGGFPQAGLNFTDSLPGTTTSLLEGMGSVTDAVQNPLQGMTDAIGESTADSMVDDIASAKGDLELVACSPQTAGLAKLSASWNLGLFPLFISELPNVRPCWNAGNPVDMLTAAPAAAAQVATGGAAEAACSGASLTDATGNILSTINESTLGLLGNCVGSWGAKKPAVGYASNLIRPLAAGVVGWRAYDYSVKSGGKNLKNTKGQVMFNLDYPFINGSGNTVVASALKPFKMSGKRHGHKGSGCYNPGTMNPSWYTEGEAMLADPATVLQNMTENFYNELSKSEIVTNNGDYVFTYWKNTRCCVPVDCPWRAKRKY